MQRTIYVAGIDRKRFAELADPVDAWLLNVGYLKNLPLWMLPHLPGRRILWDCGAFTVVPDRRVTPEEYKAYMTHHHRPGMRWLSFDVIGDPEATLWHLADMQAGGFPVIPVWHRGMPADALRGADVAIGGLVPLAMEQRFALLDWVYTEVRPQGHIHLLGMDNPEIFGRYPVRSGDSTSWLPHHRFGYEAGPEGLRQRYGDVDIPLVGNMQRRLDL